MGEINYKKLIAAADAIDRGQVRPDTEGEYAGHIKCLGDFFYDTPDIRETELENYSSYERNMFSKYDEYGAKTFYVDGSLIVSCYDESCFDYEEEESNEEERIKNICELAYKDAEVLMVSLTEDVYKNSGVFGKVLCAYHCDTRVKMKSDIAFKAFSIRGCSIEFKNNKYISVTNVHLVNLDGSISDGGYLHLDGVDNSNIIFDSIGKNLEKCKFFDLRSCIVVIKNLNSQLDVSSCSYVSIYTDKPEFVSLSECSECRVEDINFKLSRNASLFREYPINKKIIRDIRETALATYGAFIFSLTNKCREIIGVNMSLDLIEYRHFSLMTLIFKDDENIENVSINNDISMLLAKLGGAHDWDIEVGLHSLEKLSGQAENTELNKRMQVIKTLNLPAYTVNNKYAVVVMKEAFNVGSKVDIVQLFDKLYTTYGIKFRWLVANFSFILDDLYVTDVLFLYHVTIAPNYSIECVDTQYVELNTIKKTDVYARIADNGHFLVRRGSELTINILDSNNVGRLEFKESDTCTFAACNCNLGEAKFIECSQCLIKLQDCRGSISFHDCSNIIVINNGKFIEDACRQGVVHIG